MVGANVLLGEVLRCRLRQLAQERQQWDLVPLSGNFPSADPNDPLKDHDDPARDAKQGILSRDGGHFEAVFSRGAEAFAERAAALIRKELPGLRFRVRVAKDEDEPSRIGWELPQASSAVSKELPVFAPCEWTGRGLASETVWQDDEPAEVSVEVSLRHEAARRAKDGKAHDLASLLVSGTSLANFNPPETFKDLVGTGYLALIHADGNGVGGGHQTLDKYARVAYFHQNRVFLRRALKAAIDQACEGADAAPLVLLMLGGDDVLVLCKAGTAMPFVVGLCHELERLQRDRDGFRLTLGIGVVFADEKVHIYRLHETAEHLAGSAKRRVRGLGHEALRSVVDWAVYTTAWPDDPEEVRRRDWVRCSGQTTCILSRRPVYVLGDGVDRLQGLLKAADALKGAPRSQLRYLVDQIPRGKTLAELAFEELSPEAREGFKKAGVREVWTAGDDGGRYITSLLDLVELSEIERLGRTAADRQDKEGGIPDVKA